MTRNYPHKLNWKFGSALREEVATWNEFKFVIEVTRAHVRCQRENSLGIKVMRDCPVRMDGYRQIESGTYIQFASDHYPSINCAKTDVAAWMRREDEHRLNEAAIHAEAA